MTIINIQDHLKLGKEDFNDTFLTITFKSMIGF